MKYLQVSQLAIFLVDGFFRQKCFREYLVPGDKKVLIWSLYLSAGLLSLTPCLLFPIREYQHLTCLVFKGEKVFCCVAPVLRSDWTGRTVWTITSFCNKLVRWNCRWFSSVKLHETTYFCGEWHLHTSGVGGTGARCQRPWFRERVGRFQSYLQQVGGGEFSIR